MGSGEEHGFVPGGGEPDTAVEHGVEECCVCVMVCVCGIVVVSDGVFGEGEAEHPAGRAGLE